jgi:hypothetical protein
MQHRKANVDANVRRGVPLFYPVRRNLARAEKLLRNMAAVSDIQTAIAIIRKHRSGQRSSIEQLRSGLAAATPTSRATGQTTYWQSFQPGTILDVHADAEYDFPARGLDASRYVQVLQAILRAVASRLVMPEFMLTSDASNANYSSTLVAEGPAVKMFERLQHDMIVDDLEVMWRVLRGAVAAGRLDAAALDVIDIEVQPPKVAVRDRLQEAQVDEILVRNESSSLLTLFTSPLLPLTSRQLRALDHRELVTRFVVHHLVHERANQQHAAAAGFLDVHGVGRVGQLARVEAGAFVADDEGRLKGREFDV